jgi:hypothetical protein
MSSTGEKISRPDKSVRLIKKLKESRYLFCKEGIYFSLDISQIKQLYTILMLIINRD